MRRAVLTLAACIGFLGILVLVKWMCMYEESSCFNQCTVFLNDLSDTEPAFIDWSVFRNWDFPTGKCERVFVDVPMLWVGLSFVGVAVIAGAWFAIRKS